MGRPHCSVWAARVLEPKPRQNLGEKSGQEQAFEARAGNRRA
jgi:hypothetical protein